MQLDEDELLLEPNLEAYAPLPDQGEASYAKLMEFSYLDVWKDMGELAKHAPDLESEDYREWVAEHREEVLDRYEKMMGARSWLEELDAYAEIGDAYASFDEDPVSFRCFRTCSFLFSHRFTLGAMEGEPAAELDDLLLFYRVMSKWQRNTRPLIHTMIANVCIHEAEALLQSLEAGMTQAERAKVLSVVDCQPDFMGRISNSFFVEYVFFADVINDYKSQYAGIWGPFIYHRNRSLNLTARMLMPLAEEVAAGEVPESEEIQKRYEEVFGSEPLRNMGGWMLASGSFPSFFSLLEKTEGHVSSHEVFVETLAASDKS